MKSEEIVKLFIGRIKAVNPIINCVVDNRFELALEEARKVDQLIQSDQKDEETLELETPFLGVPFTIKDCFSVTGNFYIISSTCLLINRVFIFLFQWTFRFTLYCWPS